MRASSTINADYGKLVNSQDDSNIVFLLDPEKIFDPVQFVYANKSLLLFRLFEREMRNFATD